ncbi:MULTISPECIES: RNA polymerase sigma-I factor [Virgibacillus]|uniref:RNA polymerase sigma factor SigI n=1 Tax=Virgibacillus dokdonensis TaxID=302167 RepID=A0A2K9J1B0_9BACI|nr:MULTISPECIES: RNA polymerase sigma-I factor [Virgibacillus]AUJ25676.1 RNA polymerase sigma factor SigI [Virgibacillus dokdonensis]NWO13401.1 RNA polymerase sigma-I factor [Virgibacillus sp.]
MLNHIKKDAPLEELVVMAQHGEQSVQNYLLKTYQPFVAKCVSEVCKRYIDIANDDEFSIGLWAFNEAIKSYNRERGSSFLGFAKLVIKRKVIDYIRYTQKNPTVLSLDEIYDADLLENPTEILAVKKQYQLAQDSWHRKQEILDFKEKLKVYKLSLAELTEVAPKHRDARESAIHTAKVLYEDKPLRDYVLAKRKLPIKQLVKKVDISKKTIERNRKYILAVFIVLTEDYLYLKDYLKVVKQ